MLCFVLSLAIASPVFAQATAISPDPMIEVMFVPEVDVELQDPTLGTVGCYTAETYKTLLDLDIDHQDALDDITDTKFQLTLMRNSLKDAEIILEASTRQYKIMKEDRDRVALMWLEENKDKHIAETRSVWDDWVTYALIVASSVAIAEGTVLYFTIKGD